MSTNPDSAAHRAYVATWRAANLERLLAYEAAYRAANRERRSAYMAAWQRANPGRISATKARRRARKAGAPVVEQIDRAAIIERDASTCYLCSRLLEPAEIVLDHVVPLARGGEHTAANLRVACAPCNGRKGTRLLSELQA